MGRRCDPRWRQTAARNHLSEMLEDILAVPMVCLQGFGKSGEGGEDGGGYRIMSQIVKDLGMMGHIQVTPGWANGPVQGLDGQQGIEGRGMSGWPLLSDNGWQAEMAE